MVVILTEENQGLSSQSRVKYMYCKYCYVNRFKPNKLKQGKVSNPS